MEQHYLQYLAPGFDRNEVLEHLMESYGEDVWNFAYFLTQRKEMADDIAQEVFLVAYSKLYAFRGESGVKSWLLGITRNKSLHYMRSSFVRRVLLTGGREQEGASGTATADSAERVAFDRMASRELWETVMALPRRQREVLVLAYHYQLSVEETADALQLPTGTVKSRLHRARKKLAERLATLRKEEE